MPAQTPTGPLSEITEITPRLPNSRGFFINRNFTLLASGQAISNMGDFLYSTTLLVWVFVLTHSAAAVSGEPKPKTAICFNKSATIPTPIPAKTTPHFS